MDFPLDEHQEPVDPVSLASEGDRQIVAYIVATYERQLAEMRRNYNTVTAEKNRWIKLLGFSTIILVLFIVTVLLIDGLNPTIGWIRRDLAAYSANPSLILCRYSFVCSDYNTKTVQ